MIIISRENGVLITAIKEREANEICHVPNVGISRKFKVLEFVKYTGSQYPETHLKVYYSKMTEFINDEKLLINYLYASLVGPALN